MGYNTTMDEALKIRLLQEIAVRFPYTFDEIKYVYDSVKSIDATIRICEAAAEGGYDSPVRIADGIVRVKSGSSSIPHNVDLLNMWPMKKGAFIKAAVKDARERIEENNKRMGYTEV